MLNFACIRLKRGESECLRVDSGVRQGRIMSPWLFMGRREERGDCLASCMQMTWFCVMSKEALEWGGGV